MGLLHNNRTIIGRMAGEILSGNEPMPWIMIPVKLVAVVWDRLGRETTVTFTERVVVRGKDNIRATRAKIYPGCEVLAMGQGVPSYAVMTDINTRGVVTLASVLQVSDRPIFKEE